MRPPNGDRSEGPLGQRLEASGPNSSRMTGELNACCASAARYEQFLKLFSESMARARLVFAHAGGETGSAKPAGPTARGDLTAKYDEANGRSQRDAWREVLRDVLREEHGRARRWWASKPCRMLAGWAGVNARSSGCCGCCVVVWRPRGPPSFGTVNGSSTMPPKRIAARAVSGATMGGRSQRRRSALRDGTASMMKRATGVCGVVALSRPD